MDEEQIWQQLEMQNDSFWDKCMTETCRLLSLDKSKLAVNLNYPGEKIQRNTANRKSNHENSHHNGESLEQLGNEEETQDEEVEDEEESDIEHDEEEVDDDEDDEDDARSETDENVATKSTFPKANGSSVVDDQFFNLSEMHAFLDSEDKKELDRLNGKFGGKADVDSEDEIDYFDSLSESEEDDDHKEKSENGKNMMFSDFFDMDNQEEETPEQIRQRRKSEREAKNKRKEQQMKEDLGIDDSEAESSESEGNLFGNDDDKNEGEEYNDDDGDEKESDIEKSEFDLRQQRLKNRIEELEEKALADKPWQLKGEITSATRPKNSLLEEVLEFDSVARPPPLITEETTLCLEDLIKRRIKSKAWDDVERKIKPINDQQDFRKNLVLQQEKSKESLAQIYEKDYLEKIHKLNDVEDSTKPDEPLEHVEIRKAMKDLFIKLDALSNFHFTSKPVAAEAKVITNIPAIEMEEVAPVAVSDATLLAPEEIRARAVGDEIGKTERTKSDKKRERRKKKAHQKMKKLQDDKRVEEKEKLGIKVTSKEKQQQLMNQVTKSRNVIKVILTMNHYF